MNNILKAAVAIVGLLIWAGFAYLKMTPVDPLVNFIVVGLTALATHTGLTFRQGNQP